MKNLLIGAVAALSFAGFTQVAYAAYGQQETVPNGSSVPSGWAIIEVLPGGGWLIKYT